MAKKEIEKLDLSTVWMEIDGEYAKVKQEYKNVWGKKKRTMIILYFIFFLPGLIYNVFVWQKGAAERANMANNFIARALQATAEKGKTSIEKVDAQILPTPILKKHQLPLSLGQKLSGWGSSDIRKARKYRELMNAYITHTNNPEDDVVADVLVDTGLAAEFSGKRPLGRSLLSGKGAWDARGGTLVDSALSIQTSARITMIVNDVPVTIYNVLTYIRNVWRRKDKQTNNLVDVPVEETTFSGVLAIVGSEIDYPGRLLMKSKAWNRNPNKNFDLPKIKTPEYGIASDGFNKEFDLLVSQDDGVALTKAFQPRNILLLEEMASKNKNIFFNSDDQNGIVIALEGLRFDDLPLHFDNPGHFFKNAVMAQKALEVDMQPIFAIANLIDGLKESKFLK